MELVNLLITGDQSAFTALYERYFRQLYIHAFNKLGDREAAKDIVQDLFTRLWEKRSELVISGSFSSYLYTATRNRVIDHMDRQESRQQYIRSLSDYVQTSLTGDADHKVRSAQMELCIKKEIENLPDRLQQVIELSRGNGMSHKDIARELNLSEQTVKDYVKQALKLLRAKLTTLLWSLF